MGEMCNVVKETYGGDKGGFLAGQVFKFSGFVSDEGSLGETAPAEEHYAIVTYLTIALKPRSGRSLSSSADVPGSVPAFHKLCIILPMIGFASVG